MHYVGSTFLKKTHKLKAFFCCLSTIGYCFMKCIHALVYYKAIFPSIPSVIKNLTAFNHRRYWKININLSHLHYKIDDYSKKILWKKKTYQLIWPLQQHWNETPRESFYGLKLLCPIKVFECISLFLVFVITHSKILLIRSAISIVLATTTDSWR